MIDAKAKVQSSFPRPPVVVDCLLSSKLEPSRLEVDFGVGFEPRVAFMGFRDLDISYTTDL